MNEIIRRAVLTAFGRDGEIYRLKKYAIRNSSDYKQTFGPCYLVVDPHKAVVCETVTDEDAETLNSGDSPVLEITDATGKVMPGRMKKFELGPFSYKIVKKL